MWSPFMNRSGRNEIPTVLSPSVTVGTCHSTVRVQVPFKGGACRSVSFDWPAMGARTAHPRSRYVGYFPVRRLFQHTIFLQHSTDSRFLATWAGSLKLTRKSLSAVPNRFILCKSNVRFFGTNKRSWVPWLRKGIVWAICLPHLLSSTENLTLQPSFNQCQHYIQVTGVLRMHTFPVRANN